MNTSGHLGLMVVLEERPEGHKTCRNDPLGTMNIHTKFHSNFTTSKISFPRYMDWGKNSKTITRVLWTDFGRSIEAALSSE